MTIVIRRPDSSRSRTVQRNLKSAGALRARASRLTARGRYPAAASALQRALRLATKARPSDPFLLAALLNDFGVVCKYLGRFALANRMYERALGLILSSGDSLDQREALATLYHNLGGIAHAQGRFGLALRHAQRGIEIRKTIRPRDALSLAADEAALAAILADSGRKSQAAATYLRSLRTSRRRLGARHYEVGAAMANLGALYLRMARLQDAERSLRLGVSILEEALGRNHPRAASALNNLAVVCARRGKLREADALYKRVLRMIERQPRSAQPTAALVRDNYKRFRRMAMP